MAVQRSSKKRSFLELPGYTGGIRLRLPLLTVKGRRSGPHLLCMAGQHGREICGIAAIEEVFRKLRPALLRGTVTFLPVLNPPAVLSGRQDFPREEQRYRNRNAPLANFNMNRHWTEKPVGDTLAAQVPPLIIKRFFSKVDAIVDLHTHDISTIQVTWAHPRDREFGRAFGMPFFEPRMPDAGRNLSRNAAEKKKIPCILVEFSGQNRVLRQALELGVRGLFNVMKYLGMLEGRPELPPVQLEVGPIEESARLRAEAAGILVPEVATGDEVKKGQVLARILCVETLRPLQTLTAPITGLCYRIGPPVQGEDVTPSGMTWPGQPVIQIWPVIRRHQNQ